MKRKLRLSTLMIVSFILVLSLTGVAYADKGYDAVLTIDANKNTFDNPAILEIGMSLYEGYYNEQGFHVMGGKYTGFVENGQIIGSGSERVLIRGWDITNQNSK